MSGRAQVRSIAALAEFRAELVAFIEAAREALSANAMEAKRAEAWLGNQLLFWKQQIRIRQEEVVVAKNSLASRKIIKVFGKPLDCTEQEKTLRRARQRLEEAERKQASCKAWAVQLPRHFDEYDAHARCLSGLLELELPRAGNVLEKRIAALEAYAQLAPPPTPSTETPPTPE